MFLNLNHQQLEVYAISRAFVKECYLFTAKLPPDEKFGLVSQIRRAALSVHLNIAEGASRKSAIERKCYYLVARGSLVEIDAALDIASDLGYLNNNPSDILGEKLLRCFKLLSGMVR